MLGKQASRGRRKHQHPFSSPGQGGCQRDDDDDGGGTDSSTAEAAGAEALGSRRVCITGHEPQLPVSPSTAQLDFLPPPPCRRGNRGAGRYVEGGSPRRDVQMLPPPARCSQTKPGPKCLSECVRGCQSRCSRRPARHKGTEEGPLITLQPSRAPTCSICIPPTPCLVLPPSLLARQPPTQLGRS